MEQIVALQMLSSTAGGHGHAQAGSQSRKDMHDFRGSFPECFWQEGRDGGKGESLPVACSAGIWPSFSGRFLGRNTKISLQGSSTKGYVVSAADFVIPPNEKGISEYNEFFPHSLCDFIMLSHVVSCLSVLL